MVHIQTAQPILIPTTNRRPGGTGTTGVAANTATNGNIDGGGAAGSTPTPGIGSGPAGPSYNPDVSGTLGGGGGPQATAPPGGGGPGGSGSGGNGNDPLGSNSSATGSGLAPGAVAGLVSMYHRSLPDLPNSN